MNSKEIETEVIAVLARASVWETASAQYWMFVQKHGKPPELLQVNAFMRPAFLKEMAKETGESIDTLFQAKYIQLERASLQFFGLPADEYMRLYAPGCAVAVL